MLNESSKMFWIVCACNIIVCAFLHLSDQGEECSFIYQIKGKKALHMADFPSRLAYWKWIESFVLYFSSLFWTSLFFGSTPYPPNLLRVLHFILNWEVGNSLKVVCVLHVVRITDMRNTSFLSQGPHFLIRKISESNPHVALVWRQIVENVRVGWIQKTLKSYIQYISCKTRPKVENND